MDDYGPETYGDRIADVYDTWYGLPDDAEDTVAFLLDVAGAGPALELAIGTGRIALPLAEAGLEVHGIDASEAMVARLREKPGGPGIPVTMGDFADVGVQERFGLVYVVFNTLFALVTQDEQVRCLRNVAAHLAPDGAFVLEAFVPDLSRFDRGQRVQATHVGVDDVKLDVSMHDPVAQRVDSLHLLVGPGGTRTFPVVIRYAWPAELDLMARLAGMRLRERWSGWKREPFTGASGKHVSVYELDPDATG
jgi:SAM-dependent methyltransferase